MGLYASLGSSQALFFVTTVFLLQLPVAVELLTLLTHPVLAVALISTTSNQLLRHHGGGKPFINPVCTAGMWYLVP